MQKSDEKLLIKALELISVTANQAWWGTRQHCGSYFHPESGCMDCFAFEQCARNEALIGIFSVLLTAGD